MSDSNQIKFSPEVKQYEYQSDTSCIPRHAIWQPSPETEDAFIISEIEIMIPERSIKRYMLKNNHIQQMHICLYSLSGAYQHYVPSTKSIKTNRISGKIEITLKVQIPLGKIGRIYCTLDPEDQEDRDATLSEFWVEYRKGLIGETTRQDTDQISCFIADSFLDIADLVEESRTASISDFFTGSIFNYRWS